MSIPHRCAGQTQDIEPEQIHLAIKEARVLEQSAESVPDYGKAINIKTKRGVIKPRTPNQAQYIANILDHDITFGVGPAGTGKTYLAVAAAVDAPGAPGDSPYSTDPSGGGSGRKTGLSARRFKSEGGPVPASAV
ncbi:phosphate starvation-inducible protein, ATP-binding [Salmonella enterica subsp. enterica]|uniref:PhoH-like protein n=1 Tax=Salmonella enterica I TaxID=59201 RepID=A0A379WY65_SALET|nr:phosphate starvation-inducible protein, ATP-binding [Salmonella enterica subsp. enterica]